MAKLTKLHYNSPLILTFSLISSLLHVFLELIGNQTHQLFCSGPTFSFFKITDYCSLFLYSLNHINLNHLIGNLSFILLLGPILEEKYGKKDLFIMMMFTVLISSILNLIFFNQKILGASGIVFMMIMLVSFANIKQGAVPLTVVLVFILFVGKEIVNSFEEDQVSQFGHILGGICGSVFGFIAKKNNGESLK